MGWWHQDQLIFHQLVGPPPLNITTRQCHHLCQTVFFPWNVQTNSGNPTRSILVNEVFKALKKAEVRKQGKPSQARIPMTADHYYRRSINYMQSTRSLEDDEHGFIKYMLAASLFRFQFHMIARVDDTSQALLENIKAHPNNNFLLTSRLNWSTKNVHEERDARP